MPDEIELTGGGTTRVFKVGDTVRRPAREWTPAVHRLLGYLGEQNFTGAPRPHGVDERGREILDFMPGTVGHYPLSGSVRSERALVSAAQLLRRYHDATVGLVRDERPSMGGLQHPPLEPVEVVCHGDFAPYNLVFHNVEAVAMIDFDHARLGPRSWDLAYGLYRFAPMTVMFDSTDEFSRIELQAKRARMFLDAYGCDHDARRDAIAMVAPRLDALVALMRAAAAGGDEAFAGHIEDGHDSIYLRDIEYIVANSEQWNAAIA